jgi:hypothetical protein
MRRFFLLVLVAIALSLPPASAQTPGKIYRIGILTHGFVPDPADPPYRRVVERARASPRHSGRTQP